MVQILHLGDCHFDDAYYLNRPERRRLLDESREQALRAAVETAVNRQVDLFVWAGDVLDGERRVSLKTRSLLEQALSELKEAGVEIAWMTGNHDPKCYLESQGLDQLLHAYGVHIFDGPVRTVGLTARDGSPYKIVGSGHEEKGLMENRLKTYPVKVEGVVTIGLLHGSVQGGTLQPDGGQSGESLGLPPGLKPEDLYFPCSKSDLRRLGYDLICLGHVHVPYKIDGADLPAYYAGSLTGLSHKETGSRGAWLHRLGHGGQTSTFLTLSPLEWRTVALDVTPEWSLEQLNEALQAVLKNRAGQLMLRLSINGVNDKILTALRHDQETLRDRIGNAVEAAEVELRFDMVPERVLELQRTGDTFAAHLSRCLENPEFMGAVWSVYAQRALGFEYEGEGDGHEENEDHAQVLQAALHDLWPRWMGGQRYGGGGRS
ncbi:metallophosphoesterase family protein [Acidaminobacter hydrogenoformans]|uniref:DNA repair exonuclease SbcCD nuclease subunit n=1 Tax=Acidaminobacter hydrogenoformans DSM 2784 TaxID=1120920 RepID=A0A1G5RUU9_9FIRM|nr:DNA repair exonuclease [Acidaminobacter hydrogenoformans]SCZ77648.1 DNA repair exonuclease SbcCD nuclease subunit [Acidaminobacter hydrogenoformans DSM 2784]